MFRLVQSAVIVVYNRPCGLVLSSFIDYVGITYSGPWRFMCFNPHLLSGPVHPCQLDESISNIRRSAASDLGLHCLPLSEIWDARLIWDNGNTAPFNLIRFCTNIKVVMTCSCSPVPKSLTNAFICSLLKQSFSFRRWSIEYSYGIALNSKVFWNTVIMYLKYLDV